jgi:hypothetical protein
LEGDASRLKGNISDFVVYFKQKLFIFFQLLKKNRKSKKKQKKMLTSIEKDGIISKLSQTRRHHRAKKVRQKGRKNEVHPEGEPKSGERRRGKEA